MSYSVKKSIFKNTAVMMATQMITWVSGFILILFLPRYLGSEGYGKLYLAMSIQVIFQWVIDYGGQGYVPKEVSRDRQNASDIFAHSVVLRIILWLTSVVVSLALCVVAKYSWHVTMLVMILAISNLWSNLTTLLRYCYLGFEEMKYPSLASVLERSFLMLTAVPALLLGAREDVVVTLMAISTLVSFAVSMRFVKTIFPVHFSIRFQTLKRLASDGFPYFLWSLFGIIYYRIDAVMLSVMTPVAVVGWYGAAYKLFDILMFLPAIYSSALLPILSRQSKSEYNSMRNTSAKSLQFLLLAGIPIAISLVFFARNIIQTLFGQAEYGPSAILLQVFSIGMLLVYVDSILSGTVVAIDKQRPWAFVAFLAIFVNVGSNYFLIPYFQEAIANGGVGAAIATDLTELFVMVSAVFLLPKELFTRKLFGAVGKGILAGVTMSVVVLGGVRLGIPWVVQGFAGLITYVVALILLKAFEPKEIEYIAKAFSIKNVKRIIAEKKAAHA
jgi:O-antigen/teichoic acid export membrane protein